MKYPFGRDSKTEELKLIKLRYSRDFPSIGDIVETDW